MWTKFGALLPFTFPFHFLFFPFQGLGEGFLWGGRRRFGRHVTFVWTSLLPSDLKEKDFNFQLVK